MIEKTLDEKRADEYAYYQDLYLNHGYTPKRSIRLGVTNQVCLLHGKNKRWKKWLDAGAGGHVIKVPPNIKQLTRADPAHPDVEVCAPIHELPSIYEGGSFDVVSSFDVLEHVLPEELRECIAALWSLVAPGGRMITSVGTKEGGTWNGRIAHLTVEPPAWWEALLEDVTGAPATEVDNAKNASPFFVQDKPVA